MSKPDSLLQKILTAKVYDLGLVTDLELAPLLSQKTNNQVWLKREDHQPVFSFKIRGAANMMMNLSSSLLKKGVVAASSGNHAQGVAYVARKLKIKAIIVMPENTPTIKIEAVKALGAKIILHGAIYDEAAHYAKKLSRTQNLTFIPPYDHIDIIAGQGTIGLELLKQHPEPIDYVFVPIGGGGLISGIGAAIKSLKPKTRVIGVEPVDAASMYESLKKNKIVALKQVGTFADGVAVKKPSRLTFELCKHYVDEVILVSSDQICAAIQDVFEDTRTILEPSGALAIAGLKKYISKSKIKNKTHIAIASGANIGFSRLGYVTERARLGEKKEFLYAVSIPERPGSFKKLTTYLDQTRITEFNYRRTQGEQAQVFMGIEADGPASVAKLEARLQRAGYKLINLSKDELAKLHLRYTVGGKAVHVGHEYFYRFEFPEKPGALRDFLQSLSSNWSISMFHYRSFGTDYGRVLVGMEVPPKEKKQFQASLKNLGYTFAEETHNPVLKLFY
jgi:threonine dehydratase